MDYPTTNDPPEPIERIRVEGDLHYSDFVEIEIQLRKRGKTMGPVGVLSDSSFGIYVFDLNR